MNAVVCVEEVFPSPPLSRQKVTRRNTAKATQKDFRRLEEISDQKGRKSLPSVGNFNSSVICSSGRSGC